MHSFLVTTAMLVAVLLFVGIGNSVLLHAQPPSLDRPLSADQLVSSYCGSPQPFTDQQGKLQLESSYRCVDTFKRGTFTITCEHQRQTGSGSLIYRKCQVTG